MLRTTRNYPRNPGCLRPLISRDDEPSASEMLESGQHGKHELFARLNPIDFKV